MTVGEVHRAGGLRIVGDRDGVRHAIARRAVSAICETDDGETLLLLVGGQTLAMVAGLEAVLAQLGWTS